MILNREEIRQLILEKALISNYLDLEAQLQPCGFDLTVRTVDQFKSAGTIDFDNSKRHLPDVQVYHKPMLKQGTYRIQFNERINLPLNLMAMHIHRSSVMRCGATVATGFWEPGYSGFGPTLLTVHNPNGLILMKNARLCQMVFLRLNAPSEGYKGQYQNEGKAIH